jgi:hypothetical protein
MAVFEDDIEGSGFIDLEGSYVVSYALMEMTNAGYSVTPVENSDSDHILRAGWIAFGYRDFDAESEPRFWWDEVIWINFTRTRWHPTPAQVGGDNCFIYASAIRWHLYPGTTAHLIVGP